MGGPEHNGCPHKNLAQQDTSSKVPPVIDNTNIYTNNDIDTNTKSYQSNYH